ncbi:n-acetyltransferase eco [Anaeramoeba flamelloides]|uniref:N-acetyltransferase eco n=1 Tax=Anaeramoeba flamelloides TaxID=1746091 RepID=A0ABQ8XJZ1_9EUKA|nr:n-acetyltransferase eco [Anaeramoeba flamelloides]
MTEKEQNKDKKDLLDWMKVTLQIKIKTKPLTKFLDSCLLLEEKIFSSKIEVKKNLSVVEKANQLQKVAKLNGLNSIYFFDSNLVTGDLGLDHLFDMIQGLWTLIEDRKDFTKNKTVMLMIKILFLQGNAKFELKFCSSDGQLLPAFIQLYPTKFSLKIGDKETLTWRYHQVKCNIKRVKKPTNFYFTVEDIDEKISITKKEKEKENKNENENEKENKNQNEEENEKKQLKLEIKLDPKVKIKLNILDLNSEAKPKSKMKNEMEIEKKEENFNDENNNKKFLLTTETYQQRLIFEKTFLMYKTYWGVSIESHPIKGEILGIENEIDFILHRCIHKGTATFYVKIISNNETNLKEMPNSTLHFNFESFLFHSSKNNKTIRLYWDEVNINTYIHESLDNELILEIDDSIKKKKYTIICVNQNNRDLVNKCFSEFQKKDILLYDKEGQPRKQFLKSFDFDPQNNIYQEENTTNNNNNISNNPIIDDEGKNKSNKIIKVKLFENSKVSQIPMTQKDLVKETKIESIKKQKRIFTIFNKNGIGTIFQSIKNCPISIENNLLSFLIHNDEEKKINNTRQSMDLKLNQLFNKQNAIFQFEIFLDHGNSQKKNGNNTINKNNNDLQTEIKKKKQIKILIQLTSVNITITINGKDKYNVVNYNNNKTDNIMSDLKGDQEQPKFQEKYSKNQKLFLHPIYNTILIFISSTGQNLVIITPNIEQRDLFFNLFVNFRTNFINNQNQIKFLIPHSIISSNTNINNKKKSMVYNNKFKKSLFEKKDKKDLENGNNANPIKMFKIKVYSSLESFVGKGLITLFEEHFIIAYEQIIIKRYYSEYSKIYYNKNSQNYLRLNIDENLFMNFTIKDLDNIKKFIKIFNEKKKYYLKYYLEPTIYFECLISIPNKGNVKSSIELNIDSYKIEIPFNTFLGEYLIESRAEIFDPKQSLRTVKVILSDNYGYLLISFANSIQSQDFIKTYNNLKNRYISCANRNNYTQFQVINSKNKRNMIILISNNLITIFKYDKKNQLNDYCKYFMKHIKVYSVEKQPNSLIISISNEKKLNIKFKNIQEKNDFRNSFNYNCKKSINFNHNIKLHNFLKNGDNIKDTYDIKANTLYNYGITLHNNDNINNKNNNLILKNGFLRISNFIFTLEIEDQHFIKKKIEEVLIKLYPLSSKLLQLIIDQQIYLISFRSRSLQTHFILNFGKIQSRIDPTIRPKGIFYPAQLKIIKERVNKNPNDDKNGGKENDQNNAYIDIKKAIIGMKFESNWLKIKGKGIYYKLSYNNTAIEKDKMKTNKCYLFVIREKKTKHCLKFMDSELLLQFCHMFNYHAILNNRAKKKLKKQTQKNYIKKEKKQIIMDNKTNIPELLDQKNDFEISFLTESFQEIHKGFLQLNTLNKEITIWNFKNDQKKILFKDLDFLTLQKIKDSKDTLLIKELEGEKIIFKMNSNQRINRFLSHFKQIVLELTEEQNSIFSQRRKFLLKKNIHNNGKNNNQNNQNNQNSDDEEGENGGEDERNKLIKQLLLQNESVKLETTQFKTKELKINHVKKSGIIINVNVEEQKITLTNSTNKTLFEFPDLHILKIRYPIESALPKVQLHFNNKNFNFIFFSTNQQMHFKKLLRKLIYHKKRKQVLFN